jgi:hypothetical protein
LDETNGHHEFERICLALARQRITSNLIPATGPVSSGGDQGRDGESHWTNLPDEGGSAFATLASADKVVFACTIQKTGVPAKIRKDLASICGRGDAVGRVIYFTVTAVAVSKRHELQAQAREIYGVALDIWDAAAIAEHLSDPDLFQSAAEFLHLPAEQAQAGAWRMPVPGTRGAVMRPDLLDAVVNALLTDTTSVALTGLEGAGGFGKTTWWST